MDFGLWFTFDFFSLFAVFPDLNLTISLISIGIWQAMQIFNVLHHVAYFTYWDLLS